MAARIRRVLASATAGDLTGRDLACTCPLPAEGQPDYCHAVRLMIRAAQFGVSR